MSKIGLISQELSLERANLIREFTCFDPAEWQVRRGVSEWRITPGAIQGRYTGSGIHSQIFCNTPVPGEVVMEFNARLLDGSTHDLIWLWQTSFEGEPWGEGYLGCLGGWYHDYAGIEKLPTFRPNAIGLFQALVPERTYHVVSGSAGGVVFLAVDGELVIYQTDPNPPDPRKPGFFGFGLYQSEVEYRDLKLYRPQLRPVAAGY